MGQYSLFKREIILPVSLWTPTCVILNRFPPTSRLPCRSSASAYRFKLKNIVCIVSIRSMFYLFNAVIYLYITSHNYINYSGLNQLWINPKQLLSSTSVLFPVGFLELTNRAIVTNKSINLYTPWLWPLLMVFSLKGLGPYAHTCHEVMLLCYRKQNNTYH